jgi:acyl transferase domain-containing protein
MDTCVVKGKHFTHTFLLSHSHFSFTIISTGLVLLKPLQRALADKDNIYAVIRGSAANSDGRSSIPITSPNKQSHERMLRAAYTFAGIDPSNVQYVEAHGTGTLRGDPIEAGALGNVIGSGSGRTDACIIGSVKTNILTAFHSQYC